MVNVNKLRAKMVEKGLNVERLADLSGINKATIYRRFNSPDEITIEEADKLVTALQIDASDAMAIFLAQYVA